MMPLPSICPTPIAAAIAFQRSLRFFALFFLFHSSFQFHKTAEKKY